MTVSCTIQIIFFMQIIFIKIGNIDENGMFEKAIFLEVLSYPGLVLFSFSTACTV